MLQLRKFDDHYHTNFASEAYFNVLKNVEKHLKVWLPTFVMKQKEMIEREFVELPLN